MEAEHQVGFNIGRLRFLRPPPTWVELSPPTKRRTSTELQLAIGLTDDYGVQLDRFDALELRLEVVDAETSAPLTMFSLTPSVVNLRPSQSPFHTITPALSATRSAGPWPSSFRIKLSVVKPPAGKDTQGFGDVDEWMLKVLGEEAQVARLSWDDERFVFLSALSGPVELRKGPGGDGKVSDEKVQTILRTLHLPIASSSRDLQHAPPPTPSPIKSIRVVERPGLNNSTGQRLWDCAICLSSYVALNRSQLWPSAASDFGSNPPSAKRARKDERFLQIVELGAGCGTVSLAAARLLTDSGLGPDAAEVISTDVQVTVETSLKENLDLNERKGKAVALHPRARTLDWGPYSPAKLDALLPPPPAARAASATDRTLLGSDILYNPESHSLLLETLLSFMRPNDGAKGRSAKALIGYRRRTEGDDNFFQIAGDAGLKVRKAWSWGQVEIWEFT